MRLYEFIADLELDEAMIWNEPNLACFIPPEGRRNSIVLYKANEAMEKALVESEHQQIEANIVGAVELKSRFDGPNDSIETTAIEAVGAEKGYGPLLYYTAMMMHGWLAPDPETVSNAAIAVWDKFYDMGIPREYIDDRYDEETSYAYRYQLPAQIRVKLRKAVREEASVHNAFMNKVEQESSYTRDNLETFLWEAASVGYLRKKIEQMWATME